MDAIARLRAHGVAFNILTVLTAQLAKHPQKLYRFYQREDFDYIQLIPCLPGLDDTEDEYSLTPELFASFYKAFFRLWVEGVPARPVRSVTLFDNLIPLFAGVRPQQCGMLGACAPQFVVESSGDVYPCDFYVLDEYRLGNIVTDSLEDLAAAPALAAFLSEPRRPLRILRRLSLRGHLPQELQAPEHRILPRGLVRVPRVSGGRGARDAHHRPRARTGG